MHFVLQIPKKSRKYSMSYKYKKIYPTKKKKDHANTACLLSLGRKLAPYRQTLLAHGLNIYICHFSNKVKKVKFASDFRFQLDITRLLTKYIFDLLKKKKKKKKVCYILRLEIASIAAVCYSQGSAIQK